MDNIVLDIKDLRVKFPIHGGVFQKKVAEVRAVDGVSFQVKKNEVLGLVGESGSGKSTIGKAILNVLNIVSNFVEIEGEVNLVKDNIKTNIFDLNKKDLHDIRKNIQMIFQDPYSSLNERLTVNDIVREPLDIHRKDLSREEKREKVAWLLDKVGLSPEQGSRFPHEFSGGQRQRIGIARSLATNPEIIIADEPVSALDVSIQAQVINLMNDLKDEFGLTFIFIAHDLSVVKHISDRIAVMYLGDIIEFGDADDVYNNPKHPYTKSLLDAVPVADPSMRRRKKTILEGTIPSPLAKPSGCGFRTRCPIATKECSKDKPKFKKFDNNHEVACWEV